MVERKSLDDLAHSLVDGRLASQLAELACVARAGVVVEERYSRLFSLRTSRRASWPICLPECRCGGRRCRCSSPRRARSRRSGRSGSSRPRRRSRWRTSAH
ncbi:MAG: ERCC4 domain-containing protein, partial [Mycobacteriales bacterium]